MKNIFKVMIALSLSAIIVSCSKDDSLQGIRKIKSIEYGVGSPKIRLSTKGTTVYQDVSTVDAYTFYTTSDYIRDQKGLAAGSEFDVPVDDENYGMVFLAFGSNANGFNNALVKTNPPAITKDNANKTISFTANSGDNICFADYDKNNMGNSSINIKLYPFFSQLKIDVSAMSGNVTIEQLTINGGVQSTANVSIKFGGSSSSTSSNIYTGNATNKFLIQYPYDKSISAVSAMNLNLEANATTTEQNLIPNGEIFEFVLGLKKGTTIVTNTLKLYNTTDTNKENPIKLQSGTRYTIKVVDINTEGDLITEMYIEGQDHVSEEILK